MEMQKGFSTHSNLSSEQNSARDEEMNKLYESLENSFSNLNVKSGEQEDRSLNILKSLTSTIIQDHEQTLKEVQEQEKLQDKKFKNGDMVNPAWL